MAQIIKLLVQYKIFVFLYIYTTKNNFSLVWDIQNVGVRMKKISNFKMSKSIFFFCEM